MTVYHDTTFNSYFQRFSTISAFPQSLRDVIARLFASTSLKAFSVELNPFAMGFSDIAWRMHE